MATNYANDAYCQGAWLFADNLDDLSGEGNTLTGNGNLPTYSTDRPLGYSTGKSMDCDGVGDYLSRANASVSANFPGKAQKTDWAFCIWIKMDQEDSDLYMFDLCGAAYLQQVWEAGATHDDPRIYQYDSDWDSYQEHPCNDRGTGTWFHFCWSFDGADPSGTSTAWISVSSFGDIQNGTEYTETNVKNLLGYTAPLTLGSRSDAASEFDGHLYQPIFFDRTLNATEAKEIYDYGITGVDGAGLIAPTGVLYGPLGGPLVGPI